MLIYLRVYKQSDLDTEETLVYCDTPKSYNKTGKQFAMEGVYFNLIYNMTT